jgi:tetratricopeptide (TPR) repeat protein
MRWLVMIALLSSSVAVLAQEVPASSALLDALAEAPDTAAASGLEARISRQWLQSGGATVAMLLNHAAQNIGDNDAEDAMQDVAAAEALAPDNIEVVHYRALARYHQGDVAGAYRDLEAVLSREPRHFLAWRSLSEIAEAQGNLKAAFAAWQKLIELDPKTKNGAAHLEDLRRRVEGEKS